jgi:hypothetical protein
MEREAFRRAVVGVDKPMTVAGEREVVREQSDRLLMFLLRARRPEIYGDRQVLQHDGRVEAAFDIADIDISSETRRRIRAVVGDGEDQA